MAQSTNETGTIEILIEKNVVFNKRTLKSITVVNDEKIIIYIVLSSDDGEKSKTIEIPYDFFEEIEGDLWKLIDSQEKGSE